MAKHYYGEWQYFEITDYYGSEWTKCHLALYIGADGNGQWTLTSTNDGGAGSYQSASIFFHIAGKSQCEVYNNTAGTFPAGYGTTKTGTFSVGNVSSFAIDLAVCCKQDAISSTNRYRLVDTNYVTRWGSPSGWGRSVSRSYWEDNGSPSVSVTLDNSNGFTISASKGTIGHDNDASIKTYYSFSGVDGSWTACTNPFTYDDCVTPSKTDNSVIVYGKVVQTNTYGDAITVTTSKSMARYIYPNAPGKPSVSYNKSRLTIKEPWRVSWTAASGRNTNSPVAGYRIWIKKSGTILYGLSLSSSNTMSQISGSTNEYVEKKITSFTISNPANLGFRAGDTIEVVIQPYAVSTSVPQQKYYSESTKSRATYTIQNAGVVRVKVNNEWKEGQVYVKINNAWKEADTVKTKVSGKWKEAE